MNLLANYIVLRMNLFHQNVYLSAKRALCNFLTFENAIENHFINSVALNFLCYYFRLINFSFFFCQFQIENSNLLTIRTVL